MSGSMGDFNAGSPQSRGTLDEPVSATLLRDLRKIWTKIKMVIMPTGGEEETLKELRNWDLWGPLMLCLLLSITLSLSAPEGQEMLLFTSVFFIFVEILNFVEFLTLGGILHVLEMQKIEPRRECNISTNAYDFCKCVEIPEISTEL